MKESSASLNQIIDQANALFRRYRVVLFLVLLVVVYGFLLFKINTYNSVEPASLADSSPAAPATPHIDKSAVTRLKQLQDNSVNVQALFNQARQNPFHE